MYNSMHCILLAYTEKQLKGVSCLLSNIGFLFKQCFNCTRPVVHALTCKHLVLHSRHMTSKKQPQSFQDGKYLGAPLRVAIVPTFCVGHDDASLAVGQRDLQQDYHVSSAFPVRMLGSLG